MKPAAFTSILAVVLLSPATAEVGAAPDPTELEVWLAQPGSRVIRSQEVGRIESAGTRAIITALGVETARDIPNRVRGVRIDLRNESSIDHIYVDEGELVYLKHDLDWMDCNLADIRNESEAVRRVMGIERCRPSQSIPQAFCPSYQMTPEFEGLSLSTDAGHRFRFSSTRPKTLADALGRAIRELGLVDEIPPPDLIELPADELDQITASAVEHYPELASSPGIKTARYTSRYSKHSASILFWPYERTGDMAYSRLVYCDSIGAKDGEWECGGSEPRSYLQIPEQDSEVVISGDLDRKKAIALIEFARQKMRDIRKIGGTYDGTISLIVAPDEYLDAFSISVTDGASGVFALEIREAARKGDDRFEIVKVFDAERFPCG